MNLPTLDELKWLAEREDGPCISIFLPLHHNRSDAQQDRVAFGNVVDHVEHLLSDDSVKETELRRVLKPLRHLERDRQFWRAEYGRTGLAVLRSSDFFGTFRLPYQCPQTTDVAYSFYLSPLVHPLSRDVRYFVLLLSSQTARLLRCHRHEYRNVPLADHAPQTLNAMIAGTSTESSLRFQTAARGSRPDSAVGLQDGHGWTKAEEKKVLQESFHVTGRAVENLLHQETAPLILAAVKYYLPMFRQKCRYPHLLDEGVHGSPDELHEREIVDRALPIAEAWRRHRQDQAYARCQERIGTDRSVRRLEQLVVAAHYGRIETLFTSLGVRKWGRYNPIDGAVTVHATKTDGDIDLLDDAVKQTLLHGGDVYVVPSREFPDHGDFAATIRW